MLFWKNKFLDKAHKLIPKYLVVGQSAHVPAGRQIPELNRGVVTARDHLRIDRLADYRRDRVGVAGQAVDLRLRAHVPDLKKLD